jgi:hypothetical protein
MAIDQEDQDKLDNIEISKEKEKENRLQKVKEDADLWEERRSKLKSKTMEIAADPQAWLKGFLMKKAMEAGHYAISKKRRLEVAAAKEKESEIGKKDNSNKLKTAIKLKKLEIEPSEIKFGFEAEQITRVIETLNDIELNTRGSVETISNTLVSNNISSTDNSKEIVESINELVLVNTTQLKQDSKQFKADNRISAAEEAAAAGSKSGTGMGSMAVNNYAFGKNGKNKSAVKDGSGGVMSTIQDLVLGGAGGAIADRFMSRGSSSKKPSAKTKGKGGGLKGILKNIMMKFGKAGKFLMSLGSRFLLPLISTPVGWAVIAGLAVGGLVFSYWDDIVSFMSDIFKSVKSTFSKVVSKISGMFSSIGDAISEILAFFNPSALAKTLAKAILPTKYYNAVASFFGSEDDNQEKEKVPQKPVKIGANNTVLNEDQNPSIKTAGNWGKKLPAIKPNENSVIKKDNMVSEALQKGMDNKLPQGTGNWGKRGSDTNIVAPTVNNNSTNIRQEKTHDTDITNLNLNASAVISPNQNW